MLWFYQLFWWSMAQGAEAVTKSSVGFFSCMTTVALETLFFSHERKCLSF